MPNSRTSLAALAALRSKFEKLFAATLETPSAQRAPTPQGPAGLRELTGFGSNPGNLRMFAAVPAQLAPAPALVIALHGCGQTAADYDHGSGWGTLAAQEGFVVVYPEQQRANNPNTCFSWFQPSDIARDHGEALSIKQMAEHAIAKFGIDRTRVYVTGLSAGGAMAAVMLATYPETFAGGAIIAGLPYGCARSIPEALEAMFSDKSRSAAALGDHVRAASKSGGPWPKISIWHGTADTIVKPSNADNIVRQWTDVHGLAAAPVRTDLIGRHTRRTWNDANGIAVIEAFLIAGMAHGVPLAVSAGGAGSGHAGPFFLDVGLSSTLHIAQAWGLTDSYFETRSVTPAVPTEPTTNPRRTAVLEGAKHPHGFRQDDERERPEFEPLAADATGRAFDPALVIAAAFKAGGLPAPEFPKAPLGIPSRLDPGPIIDAALRAAGLKR